jgi:hypothetical protein
MPLKARGLDRARNAKCAALRAPGAGRQHASYGAAIQQFINQAIQRQQHRSQNPIRTYRPRGR